MKANKWMRGLAVALGVLLAGVVAAPIALSSQDIIAWAGSPSGLGLGDPWDTYTFVALDMAAAMCVGMVVYAAWRGETAGAFGLLVWVFAFGSAYANYRHGTRPDAPGDAWWFFPAMSLAGPALLEVTVRRIRRWVQATAGRYERPLPHFRLVRWLVALPETAVAWRLAVTEGYSRPEDAITAARMVRTRTHIRPEPALRSEASDVHRPGPAPDHHSPIERAAGAGVLPVPGPDGGVPGRDVSGRPLHPGAVGHGPGRGTGLAAAGAGSSRGTPPGGGGGADVHPPASPPLPPNGDDTLPPGVRDELTAWLFATGKLGPKKVMSTMAGAGEAVGSYRAGQIAREVKLSMNGTGAPSR